MAKEAAKISSAAVWLCGLSQKETLQLSGSTRFPSRDDELIASRPMERWSGVVTRCICQKWSAKWSRCWLHSSVYEGFDFCCRSETGTTRELTDGEGVGQEVFGEKTKSFRRVHEEAKLFGFFF